MERGGRITKNTAFNDSVVNLTKWLHVTSIRFSRFFGVCMHIAKIILLLNIWNLRSENIKQVIFSKFCNRLLSLTKEQKNLKIIIYRNIRSCTATYIVKERDLLKLYLDTDIYIYTHGPTCSTEKENKTNLSSVLWY